MPVTSLSFFFFNDTATTEIYTLSLHDALPIFSEPFTMSVADAEKVATAPLGPVASRIVGSPNIVTTGGVVSTDRKSTRLNSSHSQISYAVFCLKKKILPCLWR